MRTVFADANYWIAMANPQDQWAAAAREAKDRLIDVFLVTTDEVLVEFLNGLSGYGKHLRGCAGKMVRVILNDPNTEVIQQSRDSSLTGLAFYEQRGDKEYSLVDCISMNTMKAKSIQEVLTSDNHFAQEQFKVLMRS